MNPNFSPTFDRLRTVLLRDYPIKPSAVTPDAALESLGIDSLGVAELLFNIEDEFKISVPAEPVTLASVGDVAAFIDGLVATQHAPQMAPDKPELAAVTGL